MKSLPLIFLITLSASKTLHADARTSANYAITAEAKDAGGNQSSSLSYTNAGSAGGISGIATVAVPAETAKSGFLGQISEVTSLNLAATPVSVNEGASTQLVATATLDDATTAVLAGVDVGWSVLSGPINSISASGLAVAGNVYQNTVATVQASFRSQTGSVGLTVLNVGNDDFGIYAADGIDDTWQIQYFGANNPLGVASADADGTGQDNLFKFLAGLNPLDPRSRFEINSDPVPGQPGKMDIVFGPIVAGRTYTVESTPTLVPENWLPLTGFTQVDNGGTRTVTDQNAGGLVKFYRVQITKP